MAKGILETALDMNAIEVDSVQRFITEALVSRPELLALHGLRTGITMKEQIVFASQFPKTGIKADGTCGQAGTNPQSTLTQKFWEPIAIQDKLQHCNAELDSLFKAYFTKIKNYRERFDITGSDLEVFLMILFLESMQATIWRAAWFGDKAVAQAEAATEGVVLAADVKFYDYFDGLWAQIFDAVVAGDTTHIGITENATVTSKDAQLTLAAGAAYSYMQQMWSKASTELRGDARKIWYMSREMYDNYEDYLIDKGANYDIGVIEGGLPSISYRGYRVVNMESIWDGQSREDFVNNTTDNVYYKPHRILLTVPENIPVGTLNAADFEQVEFWYDRDTELNKFKYGFTEDSKFLEENMAVVAY